MFKITKVKSKIFTFIKFTSFVLFEKKIFIKIFLKTFNFFVGLI